MLISQMPTSFSCRDSFSRYEYSSQERCKAPAQILTLRQVEKARVFDPLGHAGLTPLGKIRLTLAGEIKMTPVEASAGEFFCSFGDPSPGTAGVYLKTLQI